MEFPISQKPNAISPMLQSILGTSAQFFRRRLTEEFVPLGVESAMPGLEVTESTWDMWAAAECELVSHQ